MAHIEQIGNSTSHAGAKSNGSVVTSEFGALALTLLASLALISLMVPPVFMAVGGAGLLAAGLLLAGGLWLTGVAQRKQAGAWDVAGLLVFLGFAAGMMCGASALI